MIDHLLIAPDQATLVAAIGGIVPVGPNKQPLWNAGSAPLLIGGVQIDGAEQVIAGWRSDIAFPVSITDNTDPANPVVLTDYHLWVALPAMDPTIAASARCVLIADRDIANAGDDQSFILQTKMTQAQLSNYAVSPVVAGSNYPFGQIE